ncbi:hypothetical protein [Jiulongibacter sediminis]|uniref:Uncharacterized protein n=1 Tax=Jiulongibacter sediminis TaxID=1605367 RepID=A0A0P7C0V0_9BACT|nr:hypothetical protein [Jiulongibacter sediminis]KPM47637.1 hypothetical protein AFM12_14235 [Jiulongibacter sediminis]TBX23429.1 hypothetical protein TK44_14245 [Jiulongibacter sediminis]
MKTIITCCTLLICSIGLAQNLEVVGTAKINSLTKNNSASEVIVKLPDGKLGTRDVSSLPTGGGGGGTSSFFVGGGSSFNGFGTGDNFVPMTNSVRTNTYDGSKTRIHMAGVLTKFEGSIADFTTAGSYTFHVMKNGSATTLTCIITGASTLSCLDSSHCVSFDEGDYIAVRFTGSGATNRPGRWSAVYTPGGTCP